MRAPPSRACSVPPKRSKPKSVGPQPTRDVESRIVTVRGQRVILSADLARVYGVATKALNQAVQRNVERFPTDFMFRLTLEEARQAAILRSQSGDGSNISVDAVAVAPDERP